MAKVTVVFPDVTESTGGFKALGNLKAAQGQAALGRLFQDANGASVSFVYSGI
jgi:hypothetical protein